MSPLENSSSHTLNIVMGKTRDWTLKTQGRTDDDDGTSGSIFSVASSNFSYLWFSGMDLPLSFIMDRPYDALGVFQDCLSSIISLDRKGHLSFRSFSPLSLWAKKPTPM